MEHNFDGVHVEFSKIYLRDLTIMDCDSSERDSARNYISATCHELDLFLLAFLEFNTQCEE